MQQEFNVVLGVGYAEGVGTGVRRGTFRIPSRGLFITIPWRSLKRSHEGDVQQEFNVVLGVGYAEGV